MFSYNIAKNADEKAFAKTCSAIESKISDIKKDELLVDVDGTQLQIYTKGNFKIKVFNDYEVDAVYVDSDMNLDDVI